MPDNVLTRIAQRYEQPISRSLIRAFNILRNQQTVAQIEQALLTGGIEAVMAMLDNAPAVIGSQIRDELDDAIRASGRASLGMIPSSAVINPNFRFSTTNPATVEFIRKYELNLVREVSQETLAAVRQGLTADIIAGVNPRRTARTFKTNIGLTQQQEKAVRNYRNSLETLNSDALSRQLRDKRFDKTINRAIADNQPLRQSQVDRMTLRYKEKYIKYRTEVIARTESLRATSIGNQQAVDQMLETGAIDGDAVKKFWVFTRDKRTRDSHMEVPSMNLEGVRLDGSFFTPLGMLKYPRDPEGVPANTVQCRCSVVYRPVKKAA